jgi:hypothetical protein
LPGAIFQILQFKNLKRAFCREAEAKEPEEFRFTKILARFAGADGRRRLPWRQGQHAARALSRRQDLRPQMYDQSILIWIKRR